MTNPTSISPLRQRMIKDMSARALGRQTQRGHILACKRFAAYLKRSPDQATAEDVRLFQLHLMESGLSIQNRNRTMIAGVKTTDAKRSSRSIGKTRQVPRKWRVIRALR